MQYIEKISERGEKYIELAYEDGRISLIPVNPLNADYQDYLRFIAGNDLETI